MSSVPGDSTAHARLTPVQWLICFIAAVGFLFDIYELLMLPLILKPALATLGGMAESGGPRLVPGSEEFTHWARLLFFVPALVGGVFGLLGGKLTDRFGRRRVLTYSILLYGVSAFGAGYATSLWQLLVLRCLVFTGVCVEFVAAVAWLAEIFPDKERRERVLAYTQAFGSAGGFLVAVFNGLAIDHAAGLPAIHGAHEAWRYTLISGLLPAIPLILIRPFLPESPVWQRKKDAGTLARPSIGALFAPEFLRTTLVSAVVVASCYGMAFGAIQHLPQIVPGLADVKATVQQAQADLEAHATGPVSPKQKIGLGKEIEQTAAKDVQLYQEIGGLLGRVALGLLVLRIASRRLLLGVFHGPALIVVPAFFWWLGNHLDQTGNLSFVKWGAGLCGFFVVATFSFWGNYLPRVYPLHLRGTGESFAANIGGRILGTSAAWFTFTFSAATPPSPSKIAHTAAIVAGVFAVVGVVLLWWMPEPRSEDLGDD